MVEELKIAEGFQQTDAGIIPNDWVVKPMHEVAHFENGKAHEQFIDEHGDYIVVNSKFISTEGRVKKFSKKNIFPLKKGDITIVMSDIPKGKALAKCFLIDKEDTYTLNQRIGGITANDDTDNKYLFYKLNRNRYYLAFDSGTGQTNIKRQQILDCPIALPPTKLEQTAISNAIFDINSLIVGLENLLIKKRNIKLGAMQELFKPKDGWLTKELGFFLSQNPQYGIGAASVPFNLNLPTYLRITDISDEGRLIKSKLTSVDSPFSSNYFLEDNDIVFARTGNSVGKSYLYNPQDGKLVYAGFLIRIKVDTKLLSPQYLKYFIQTNEYWSWVRLMSMRTGQPGINGQEYKSLPINIPKDRLEQNKIADVLQTMDAEIEHLVIQLNKYISIKIGMKQDVLNGKRRFI